MSFTAVRFTLLMMTSVLLSILTLSVIAGPSNLLWFADVPILGRILPWSLRHIGSVPDPISYALIPVVIAGASGFVVMALSLASLASRGVRKAVMALKLRK